MMCAPASPALSGASRIFREGLRPHPYGCARTRMRRCSGGLWGYATAQCACAGLETKKKPPAQLRRGWGHAPRGLHRRRLRGWSRTPSGVLCESVGRVYAHSPRMLLSTLTGCLSAADLLIPVALMTSATNCALVLVATG